MATSHHLRARVDAALSVPGAAFRDLALTHAASTAGDTLVALALAGTLFFSVPSTEARGNVLLYLLLTVAPFAVIGPLLGRLLDRSPVTYRLALVASSALRTGVAVVLATAIDSLWLFPGAFALLVLSRVHGISRQATLPQAIDDRVALVAANGRIAWIGVVGGAVVVAPGALIGSLAGPGGVLVFAAGSFGVATVVATRLPRPPAHRPGRADGRARLSRSVRLAQLATAGVRLLNGFLVLLLAFAFRDREASLLDFGAVLAAAGVGYALAAITSPRLEARLREEPMVVAALALEAGAAFAAGQWFGLPAAAALAAAAGFSWGTAKLAFDGLLQATIPTDRRGSAFTRSETVFQLAWVAGAAVPAAIPLPTTVGLAVAGFAALGAQVVYVGHLLLPLTQGRPAPPTA